MNRLILFVTLLALRLPCFAESPKQQLLEAILCKADSLQVIREIVEEHPFDSGVAAISWGDEMDEKNVVIVEGEIVIGGATARAVRSQFETPYPDFHGIVFAEFRGDHLPVVKELGLKPMPANLDSRLGAFTLARPTGDKDEVCPPTVALTPLGDGKFVLGCGWCNG